MFSLFVTFSAQAFETNKSSNMTNSAIGQFPTISKVVAPDIYFSNRVKALKLVREKNWQTAKPALESLTSQYKDDGDTWYTLGVAYFQLKEWEKAIYAFKRTIDLGTILSSVPTGSAPSNDIMIKIAEAYAELDQEASAILWINKSLDARYDGRNRLIENLHFKKIADSKAFLETSGAYIPSNLSRIDSWLFDFNFLVAEIKRLHVNVYHSVSKDNFEKMVVNISSKIPSMTDQEIVFEMMKLVATMGNGHNFIVPAYSKMGSFSQLPFQFYLFSDGLFIVAAESRYQHLIGTKVIKIGKTAVEEALARTKLVNARDNEMQHLWLGPHYLGLSEVLKGLDIVENTQDISITIKKEDGKLKEIKPKLKAMNFSGFPKLPALTNSNAIHNLQASKPYWYQHIPNQEALYIQYNYVTNASSQSFVDFNAELIEKLTQLKTENLILDIRHNAGGDGSTYPPLLKTLIQFEALNPKGKIFVVMGRNTFSAAHNLLLDINRLTNPILVGEPSGSRPNALGEAGWFKLPYSGTWGIISSQFHQASKAEDHRIWVAPHVPVSLSSVQYFAGDDPAMQAINRIISAN